MPAGEPRPGPPAPGHGRGRLRYRLERRRRSGFWGQRCRWFGWRGMLIGRQDGSDPRRGSFECLAQRTERLAAAAVVGGRRLPFSLSAVLAGALLTT